MLASGFVPAGRLRVAGHGTRLGLFVVVVSTLAVAVPLYVAAFKSSSGAQVSQAVNEAVVTWLSPNPALKPVAVTIQGRQVTVAVAGPVAPPSSQSLSKAIDGILGSSAVVQLRWYQYAQATARRNGAAKALTTAVVQPLVMAWLAKAANQTRPTQIVAVDTRGSAINVKLAGGQPPPSASLLADAISRAVGRGVTVTVVWNLTR